MSSDPSRRSETSGGAPTGGWRRYLAATGVSGVGVALLSVPAFDIWDDATNLEWSIVSTLVENSVLIAMSLSLVVAGVWLFRSEWSDDDVALVSWWVITGAAGVTVVYGFVIVLQLWAMHRTKPYVLAADGVLMASVVAFGIGVYDARRRQTRRELTDERNRFRSFFRATDSPTVSVEYGGEFEVRDRNEAFESTFAADLQSVLDAAEPVDDSEFSPEAFHDAVRTRSAYAAEIRVPPDVLREGARPDDELEDVAAGRYFELGLIHVETESFVVLSDVTARKQRERLLESERDVLEREKTRRERELERRTNQLEFLHSLLRHDVQNGMMVIESRGEFLESELDGREAEYAETITSRASDVSEEIDRLRTTLDTLTAGERDTVPVDLTAVLEDRARSLREANPDVDVRTDVDPELAVMADEILEDVFANLLRNAVEHNDSEDPRVWISTETDDERVRVEVADNGPGVDENVRDDVFRRGVSTANDGGPGGSGFGLFFVDTMVNAYGGDVRVEDNEPRGARFVIELRNADGDWNGDE